MQSRLQSRGPWNGRSGWVLAIAVGLLVSPLGAQETSEAAPEGQFLKKVFKDGQGAHKYQVFLPAGYDAQKRYPTILYLHGSDECGRDGVKQVEIGLGPLVRARADKFPFIVVFPQCETVQGRRYLERWLAGSPDAIRALEILERVEQDYSVDRDREIVTGWSMGGYGAWSLAMADPSRWAAVVPVSGGGDTTRVAALKDTPVWVVHGPKDRIVFPERSREMVAALKAVAGARVRLDEPESEAHGVWQWAYDSQILEAWLANPRDPLPGADVRLEARGTPLPRSLQPFVPVAHVGGAAYLRVGREVLDSIVAAIPTAVPKDLLSGKLEPITIQDIDGGTRKKRTKSYYEATLEDISYRGEIHSAEMTPRDDGTVLVKMALKNIIVDFPLTRIHEIKLEEKRVRGRRRFVPKSRKQKFLAYDSQILVARRKPVLLEFVLKPTAADRRLSLGLVKTGFQIAPDQFEVVGPPVVEATGLFQETKRKRVYERIVASLLEQRGLVEDKVQEAVPTMLTAMEQKLELADSPDLLSSLWPLPVFQPRVRLWPEAVVVEKSGLSVAMGITVAAADPATAPAKPRELVLVKDLITKVPKTRSLRVGVAPGLLDPLTQMVIDGGLARIDVRDTPEPLVRKLGDRGVLARVIPAVGALPATTKLRTELVLTRPISISPTDESASASKSPMGFRFKVPGAQLIVSTRSGAEWEPMAVFDFTLEHTARLKFMDRVGDEGQSLKISFPMKPVIKMTGQLSPDVKVGNRQVMPKIFQAEFDRAWQAFARKALESTVVVSDLEFGEVSFPLTDIDWSSPLLSVEFGLAPQLGVTLPRASKPRFEAPVIKGAPGENGSPDERGRRLKRQTVQPRR